MNETRDMLIVIAATAISFLGGLWLFNMPIPAAWGTMDIYPPRMIGVCLVGLGILGEIMLLQVRYNNVSD